MANILKRFNDWLAQQPATNDQFQAPTQQADPMNFKPAATATEPEQWANPREQWEKAAKDTEIGVLAKAEERLAAYRADHRKDAAGFKFDCKRHGDFLAVFVTRIQMRYVNWTAIGPEPFDSSATINLGQTRNIVLTRGHVPDTKGRVGYRLYWEPIDQPLSGSSYSWNSGEQFTKPVKGHRLRATEAGDNYLLSGTGTFAHPIIDTTPPPASPGSFGGYGGWQQGAGYETPNYPRPAANDAIDFVGANIRLVVPAGKGQGVYDAIMAALETKPAPASLTKLKTTIRKGKTK